MRNRRLTPLCMIPVLAAVPVLWLIGCTGHKSAGQPQVEQEQVSCRPVGTRWHLSVSLNHDTWREDSLGCDGSRHLITQPEEGEQFRELFEQVGREYIHKALGTPKRSYINAARHHIDVYPIDCAKSAGDVGEEVMIVYDAGGCFHGFVVEER